MISSEKGTVFQEHIFAPDRGWYVYYPLSIFYSTRQFENWRTSLTSSSFNWGIFSHTIRLAQSDTSGNIWWITVEPQFNEVAGDRPNLFAKSRARYIENLDVTNLWGNDQNVHYSGTSI